MPELLLDALAISVFIGLLCWLGPYLAGIGLIAIILYLINNFDIVLALAVPVAVVMVIFHFQRRRRKKNKTATDNGGSREI